MGLGWIDVTEFSFNCFLMMERFQIRMMMKEGDSKAYRENMGIALKANPAVLWYLTHKCPERAEAIAACAAAAPEGKTAEEIRAAEISVLEAHEDFVIYTQPERMSASCGFIRDWRKARLFEMADLSGKAVLDVGSGSGRLAFAAAEIARAVYASEPVDALREYLRDEIARRGIRNMRVCDGLAESLPFPDGTFDVVMSGHVMGDDYDNEIREMARVTKPGGWILDCPGEENHRKPDGAMTERGFEEMAYESHLGGKVYRYRKQVDPV